MSNLRVQMAEVPLRAEIRQRVVHLVEYSRYPRRDPNQPRQVAYTQDRSSTGLGLDLPEVIEPGELLRITLRDIDGKTDVDGLARVVWCREGDSGRARAGLSLLREDGQKRMMRIRDAEAAAATSRRRHSDSNEKRSIGA
jgi:hypothetical protein